MILYERERCGLCDEVREVLRRLRIAFERVDIDTDDELRDRYTLRVPVLAAGGDELDAAGLEEPAIERWLTEVAGSG